MELQEKLKLIYSVDDVLRGQGANPSDLRNRRSDLVTLAAQAREESLLYIHPKVIYKEYAIIGKLHDTLLLEQGFRFKNKLIAKQLANSKLLIVILVTIGLELEQYIEKIWGKNMVYALALDGAGTAAVEALANAVCNYFEQQAKEKGWNTTAPYSPGMIDFPLEEGQPQIFRLLGEEAAVVKLTSSFTMEPRKSMTMVLGLGEEPQNINKPCDFCMMQATCKYQRDYE